MHFILHTLSIMLGIAIGLAISLEVKHDVHQDKCVARYGDMPANKVQEYCKELLMFKVEDNHVQSK